MNPKFRKFLWFVLILLFAVFTLAGFYSGWYFVPAAGLAAYGVYRYFW